MVYQRRMLVEALKTKALLLAQLNPEQASKAAKDYMEHAIPVDAEAKDAHLRAKERELEQLANAEPIRLSDLKMGTAMEGTKTWTPSSMHKH